MTPEQWKSLKHFTIHESWGNPELMSYDFVRELDAFRDFINSAVVITFGTNGQHAPTSHHFPKNNPNGEGCAADMVFPSHPLANLLDLFITVSRFAFTGVGLYTNWSYGGKPVCGMHLEKVPGVEVKKLWMGVPDYHGGSSYTSLCYANLKTYVPQF